MTGQKDNRAQVYGIGNPLIDIHTLASDSDIEKLELEKGTMTLIDTERGNKILKHLESREKQYSCGGSAPNTMITLAALGTKTSLAGMIGNDDLGGIYQNNLKSKNVISDLVTVQGGTGSCIVLVTPDFERTMSTRLGVCQEFGPEHVNHQAIADADYFYFTGYMWDTDSQKTALKSAIQTARKNDTKVAFDVADPFCVERHYDEFHELIGESVDLLFANRDEARLLMGFDDPEKASAELAQNKVIAAVKNSASGSFISAGGSNRYTIKACQVNAVDSTGAGDTYAAGFLYALISGYSLADAGRLASFVAAQIVQKTGAQFDQETVDDIKSKIQNGTWQ